jgi:hypothetical protein
MKNQTLRDYAITAIAGLLVAAGSPAYTQHVGVPDTGDGSADQLVQVDAPVAFSVNPVDGGSYQWLRNGTAILGQTNRTLIFENTQISDAGYYSCNTTNGADIVPSIAASLEVYTITPDFLVVVYAAPITSTGNLGTCPGPYKGYVSYIPTNGHWGFTPLTGTTIYTASDTTRTNTKVQYVGDYGDSGCARTTVTIPYPAVSPLYRFAIYFTNNVPSTNYPITLAGFSP